MKMMNTSAVFLFQQEGHGWQEFVLVALECVVALLILNELAARAIKNKRRGRRKRGR